MKPPYQDSPGLRQTVIDACLEMNAMGINQGTSGNISVRAGDMMLITPSGVPYEKMTPKDLVKMPLDGSQSPDGQLKPSTEWPFHLAILQAKPAVNAVVHAHPVYCSALAMNRQAIPACHYMVAAFGGNDVPVADYALFGSRQLSDNITRSLQNRSACLMANHGAVATGESLPRALWRMGELEALAKGYATSLTIGRPHILTETDMQEVTAAFADYGLKDSR
ncbi:MULTISPECIES: class II aldolase/adducin family protein [unclassified Leisingera]|uniref:class II aldolase/adducin family protein n=1 Tax=unclassified Leisingera TaxID=2614906 RepID=UPI0010112DC9|nr:MULTISPECIES: class II aldolase/adducin family protein [unclassified Leisingera]MBQ4823150.1 class II aldolase/adducin family protein [Leisingera sp. HS039]QAX29639.1 class II aldolase [Leisingera sp. NJS204]QBR36375.1 class II aldolase [Leisingera sp. NJS201]